MCGLHTHSKELAGNLLEMQISMKLEILGVGPNNLCFNKPPRWFWSSFKFKNLNYLTLKKSKQFHMVTDGYRNYQSEHFAMYLNVQSLC